MSKGFALRLALVAEPLLVTSSCEPSGRTIAATVLVATPLAYAIALLLLACLAMLWRRRGKIVELEWRWLLGYFVVLTGVVLVLADVDDKLFRLALPLTTLYVAAGVGLLARLAVEMQSKRLMRLGPALVLVVLALPNVAVFFSRRMEAWISDIDGALLAAGCWIWAPSLLLLVFGPLLPRRRA